LVGDGGYEISVILGLRWGGVLFFDVGCGVWDGWFFLLWSSDCIAIDPGHNDSISVLIIVKIMVKGVTLFSKRGRLFLLSTAVFVPHVTRSAGKHTWMVDQE
jgi:hypothetical protein